MFRQLSLSNKLDPLLLRPLTLCECFCEDFTRYVYRFTQEPRKIVIGQYHKKVRGGNKFKDIRKTDDAYYIPLSERLEQLLNDDSILEEVST